MKTRLTFRYILMLALSFVLLVLSAFIMLTHIENTDSSSPTVFASNFVDEIKLVDNKVSISDSGQKALKEKNAWLQILDEEAYVVQSFNEPNHAKTHYAPSEFRMQDLSLSYGSDYFFDLGRTAEKINYLIAVPKGNWTQYSVSIDQQMSQKFLFRMLLLAVITFLVMGFIFSQRIAGPVSKMITGIESLADGDYKIKIKENGLYKNIYSSLNKLAEQLKKSEIEEEKTKKQREKWISNISHDLKTPLSTIKGYSELLSDKDYELSLDERKEYSEIIHEKSIYMEEMIEELRLNEQLMHRNIHLDKEWVNLTDFIRELIIDILNHPKYKGREIEFYSDNENLDFCLEKSLMKRAIENLIYNALIYNNEQTKIELEITEKDSGILIRIKDDGQGMSKEDLNKIFSRYYRGSNTKDFEGTGLGMSIAKEVIEAHDGKIIVKSKLNKGTEINIRL